MLSAAEYAALTAARPETPKQRAKALYEFRGQTDKELNLDQVLLYSNYYTPTSSITYVVDVLVVVVLLLL